MSVLENHYRMNKVPAEAYPDTSLIFYFKEGNKEYELLESVWKLIQRSQISDTLDNSKLFKIEREDFRVLTYNLIRSFILVSNSEEETLEMIRFAFNLALTSDSENQN